MQLVQLEAGRSCSHENDLGIVSISSSMGNLEIIKAYGTADERLLQDWGPGNLPGRNEYVRH